MKQIGILAVMCVGLGTGAVAQDTPPAAPAAKTATAAARTPDQVATYYQTKLSLTDDQRKQLVPIIAERQQKMQDLKSGSSRPRVKMQKMKGAMDDADKKIKSVLTGAQWTKYQAMEAAAKEQRKEQRNGGE